jgi:hypothetical protein
VPMKIVILRVFVRTLSRSRDFVALNEPADV